MSSSNAYPGIYLLNSFPDIKARQKLSTRTATDYITLNSNSQGRTFLPTTRSNNKHVHALTRAYNYAIVLYLARF